MKDYIIKTTATMKEYNRRKWWIDSNIVAEKHIAAETLAEAIKKYRQTVENSHGITISNNAIKYKSPMYIETANGNIKQVGYVITGKAGFQNDFGQWTNQYIDLWLTVLTVIDTEFEENFREVRK